MNGRKKWKNRRQASTAANNIRLPVVVGNHTNNSNQHSIDNWRWCNSGVVLKMSMYIEKWKYKKMLRRRIVLIEKKLREIDEIKLKYGTMSTMGNAEKLLKYIDENRKDLED